MPGSVSLRRKILFLHFSPFGLETFGYKKPGCPKNRTRTGGKAVTNAGQGRGLNKAATMLPFPLLFSLVAAANWMVGAMLVAAITLRSRASRSRSSRAWHAWRGVIAERARSGSRRPPG